MTIANPLIIALAEDVLCKYDNEEAEALFEDLCLYLHQAIKGWEYHIEQVREYAEGHPREDYNAEEIQHSTESGC